MSIECSHERVLHNKSDDMLVCSSCGASMPMEELGEITFSATLWPTGTCLRQVEVMPAHSGSLLLHTFSAK